MAIWFREYSIQEINELSKETMLESLHIKFNEIGDNYLKATMPVNKHTIQTHGVLHGGASVVLAETLGSVATMLCLDNKKQIGMGQEINANHIRPVKKGSIVEGITTPVHLGRGTHIWDIKIYNQDKKLVNVSRLTVAVRDK